MARRWLVAAALLLALGGCGDEPDAEPANVPVPVTSEVSPAPSTSAVADRTTGSQAGAGQGPDRFAAVVQRELPGLVLDRRDEEITALARQTCAALAAGRSAGTVVAGVRDFGTDRAGADELIRLAISTVCPEQGHRTGEF